MVSSAVHGHKVRSHALSLVEANQIHHIYRQEVTFYRIIIGSCLEETYETAL
jgi:hypothetical protein